MDRAYERYDVELRRVQLLYSKSGQRSHSRSASDSVDADDLRQQTAFRRGLEDGTAAEFLGAARPAAHGPHAAPGQVHGGKGRPHAQV